MPKAKGKKHHSLTDVLLTEEHSVQVRQAIRDRRKAGRARHEGKEEGAEGDDAAGDGFLSERVSRRILETAREQAHELEAEALGAEVGLSREDLDAARRAGRMVSARASGGARSAGGLPPPRREGDEDDEEEEEEDEEEDEEEEEEGGVAVDESGYVDAEGGAEEEDEELVRKFMSQSTQERRTLASALAERIRGEEEADTHRADAPTEESERKAALGITPKVERVYEEVGKFLATYRSGKLPKVFKVLPALDAWEEMLLLTRPEGWSVHAVCAATKVFASNLNAARAQRFFNTVLLPAVRDDIAAHGKLNYHLYEALRKALYKPAAFIKGLLLPLAESGNCSIKEARIIGSSVLKRHVPQMHAVAALFRIAAGPYHGATSIFIAQLLQKHYALPYPVIDAVCEHFVRFKDLPGPLPVIWHQALLTFAQRYKTELTVEQKAQLRDLLAIHAHHAISREVKHELFTSPCRGQSAPSDDGAPSASASSAATPHSAPAAAAAAAPRPFSSSGRPRH